MTNKPLTDKTIYQWPKLFCVRTDDYTHGQGYSRSCCGSVAPTISLGKSEFIACTSELNRSTLALHRTCLLSMFM